MTHRFLLCMCALWLGCDVKSYDGADVYVVHHEGLEPREIAAGAAATVKIEPTGDEDYTGLESVDVPANGDLPPLPDNLNLFTGEAGVVLRAAEVDLINAQVDGYNAAIDEAAAAFGYPVFDVNALFADISSGAYVPTYGGTTLSTQFLLGGIFSYDGIHPQHIGYAMMADELIQFINAEYGSEIPRVDMAEVLFEGDWQSPGISPAKARETVMSAEAFQRLYELFPPKLDQAPRIRRPSATRSRPSSASGTTAWSPRPASARSSAAARSISCTTRWRASSAWPRNLARSCRRPVSASHMARCASASWKP